MSQRNFEKLHRILPFNDNSKQSDTQNPAHDKLHKIKPILDYINQKYLSVPMAERQSIDDQIFPLRQSSI